MGYRSDDAIRIISDISQYCSMVGSCPGTWGLCSLSIVCWVCTILRDIASRSPWSGSRQSEAWWYRLSTPARDVGSNSQTPSYFMFHLRDISIISLLVNVSDISMAYTTAVPWHYRNHLASLRFSLIPSYIGLSNSRKSRVFHGAFHLVLLYLQHNNDLYLPFQCQLTYDKKELSTRELLTLLPCHISLIRLLNGS